MAIHHDKKQGLCCFVTSGVILLLCSGALAGTCWFLVQQETSISQIIVYVLLGVLGGFFFVFSVFGLAAVCGGCMIYSFFVVSLILCIFCILAAIFFTILVVLLLYAFTHRIRESIHSSRILLIKFRYG